MEGCDEVLGLSDDGGDGHEGEGCDGGDDDGVEDADDCTTGNTVAGHGGGPDDDIVCDVTEDERADDDGVEGTEGVEGYEQGEPGGETLGIEVFKGCD